MLLKSFSIFINPSTLKLIKLDCHMHHCYHWIFNTACWQEAAGRLTGCILDPPLSTWKWLGWYSEASKRVDRHTSEYHHNHCHMEKEASKTHPIPVPAGSNQHRVLSCSTDSCLDKHWFTLINTVINWLTHYVYMIVQSFCLLVHLLSHVLGILPLDRV